VDVAGIKEGQKMIWTAGDFGEIATLIEPASEAIVNELTIEPGDKLLDVACGTGNISIPAAKLGADVTGLDLTPKLLEEAKVRAEVEEVEVTWVEGDAEVLPFADDSFAHVVSCFGMIFAPQHDVAAAEMARVCEPGGNLAITSWAVEGLNGQMFSVVGKHMPAPPEPIPTAVDWGTPEYIMARFAPTGAEMNVEVRSVEFRALSAEGWVAYNEEKLGPMLMAKAALAPQGLWDPLRQDLVAMYEAANIATDGTWVAKADFLLATGKLPLVG
jgi:SAM-dependent methyltransferase